jgi:hypothetical protein
MQSTSNRSYQIVARDDETFRGSRTRPAKRTSQNYENGEGMNVSRSDKLKYIIVLVIYLPRHSSKI